MNRILNPCQGVEIDGQLYPMRTDFRVWIQAESILADPQIPWKQGVVEVLTLIYPELPPDPRKALQGILWFLGGGKPCNNAEEEPDKPQLPLLSLKEDFPYIWAGFLGQFGIDLQSTKLHWWHFCTLLQALDSNSLLGRVMFYRQVNPNGIADPATRRYYMQMKKRYRLSDTAAPREIATALAIEESMM